MSQKCVEITQDELNTLIIKNLANFEYDNKYKT